jgi:cytochrome oxidase Cu insertion factor (SCO1/SenC/PrrC family)
MAKRRKQKRGNSFQSQTSPKSRAGLIVGAVTVGLLALVGAYFLIFANTQTPAPAAQVAQVTEESADAFAVDNGQQIVVEDTSPDLPIAPKVGALAPDFTLADTAGSQVSLAAFRGKPVVVTFFHTW